MRVHHYQDLITLFNRLFADSYRTQLVAGGHEPLYSPATSETDYHKVIFAHGFYASAFHEISHWCIAGEKRRQLEDYGYWYCPDGRTAEKQNEFELVEIKPQALDWLFCVAADFPFNVSCDNLNGDFTPDRVAFQRLVYQQVMHYLDDEPIPARAKQFIDALHVHYGTKPLSPADFAYPKALDER